MIFSPLPPVSVAGITGLGHQLWPNTVLEIVFGINEDNAYAFSWKLCREAGWHVWEVLGNLYGWLTPSHIRM